MTTHPDRMTARTTFKGRSVDDDIVTTDDEELRFWLMDILEHEEDGTTFHQRELTAALTHLEAVIRTSRARDDLMTKPTSPFDFEAHAQKLVAAVRDHSEATNAAILWAREVGKRV